MDSDRILHITSNDQHVVDHLADKLGVVDDVELLPGEELLAAHEACETLEMEHLVSGFPHQVLRADPLATAAAFRSKPPEKKNVKSF